MTTLISWVMAFATLLSAVSALGADRPRNIVLIYGDDVGFGDVGCYGAKSIPTPHIDRLAAGGLRFTSGYASSATCTPSRYSMLTGEYAWREPGRGIAPPNGSLLIEPGKHTLATLLRSAGFRCGLVGKWHLGLGTPPKPDWSGELKPGPLEVGFDECFILPTTNDRVPCVYVRDHNIVGLDASDPVDVFNKNPDGQPTGVTHRDSLKMNWSHGHNNTIVNGIGRIGYMVGGEAIRWVDETMAEVFVKEAEEFIDRQHEDPFFLFYSAHQIHVPRAPNERFVGKTPHGPRGDAMVEFDWSIGRIIDRLEKHGLLEETLIVITSDNGPVLDDGYQDQAAEALGDHKPLGPFRGGKYSRFEGGTRVPWVVHWPAKISPGVTDAMISQVDLYASFATIVGAKAEGGIDSQDVSAAMLGKEGQGRTQIVEHSGFDQELALRQGDWKYIAPNPGPAVLKNTSIESANSEGSQLYNLKDDPGEQNNLAESQPELVAELAAKLESIRLGE